MKRVKRIFISRIILFIIAMIILLFPFYEVGMEFPVFLISNSIIIDFKYILVGFIFISFILLGYLNEYMIKRYNIVLMNEKIVDNTVFELFTLLLLIILACDGKIDKSIVVVVVSVRFIINYITVFIRNNGYVVKNLLIDKIRNIILLLGIILTLFYNLPFELISLRLSTFLLVVASIISIITLVKYYYMAKLYLRQR